MLLPGMVVLSQDIPTLEPGVSHDLAKWRAARYSDIRYKLSLTLEKMSPVLKGSIEISVKVNDPEGRKLSEQEIFNTLPIVLDWRKIVGHEDKHSISNASINGQPALPLRMMTPTVDRSSLFYQERNEHLVFQGGVKVGENVVKLDFTSPILTSGSAITRYIDKEDGSEYIYSLFVPSDASTAFPVFDQPDLKAKFTLNVSYPESWKVISNAMGGVKEIGDCAFLPGQNDPAKCFMRDLHFTETRPISTYVFAFAAGPWKEFKDDRAEIEYGLEESVDDPDDNRVYKPTPHRPPRFFVRKSQALKFESHFAEAFRLNREGIKYFEQYFEYKFPFPKYDLVLIPEFPFGGMEHAGATFLRESSIIFPQAPTKNDYINRATLIFHETAHQWFGDTVTMRWFDDLWLKEGFATFMGYKAMEKIMPEMNSWKVFYERVKQAAYQTDSTKGTTPIYQEIPNLSAAKSAYGNIVYNKAPAFLRQAEFYLGEDKFQAAARAFLQKHEFGNARWEDLEKEFETASERELKVWAKQWVTQRGLPIYRSKLEARTQFYAVDVEGRDALSGGALWKQRSMGLIFDSFMSGPQEWSLNLEPASGLMKATKRPSIGLDHGPLKLRYFFPNYRDYGYGIFLLDDKSRDYVLKNIQNEKDLFLRSMMWGALWDSVREGELDPREYVELVVKVLISQGVSTTPSAARKAAAATPRGQEGSKIVDDESTVALLLNRVSTAMNYYLSVPGERAVVTGPTETAPDKWHVNTAPGSDLQTRVEDMLLERMQNASSLGQRITFYRAFLNIASSDKARQTLKDIVNVKLVIQGFNCAGPECGMPPKPVATPLPPVNGREQDTPFNRSIFAPAVHLLKTKDKFDIVTRLIILGDPDGLKLLAHLEKTETSDDAKRYAYAAKAGTATPESKAKYWNDFISNKEISESWIEAAFVPFNSIKHERLTLRYLESALKELPNHKRNRKIFFVNGWLGAFIGGQRSEEALAIVNKFLADNPSLDRDLRLKILENVDVIERAVRIRKRFAAAIASQP
jgi:aminopeptidase N